MDGIHDLGGRQGFGPVVREAGEPVFRQRWEARVFALVQAAGAAGAIRNTDQFRHAIERMDPVAYLTHGYYGRWLGGVETLLREAGVVTREDIEARIRELGGDPEAAAAARPDPVPDRVDYRPGAAGARRSAAAPPAFRPGEVVRTVSTGKVGHTRLPAYARGRLGTVTAHHGGWVLPDSNAHGRGEQPQHLYSIAFAAEELWGRDAEPGVTVSVDLFESYLVRHDEA